MGSSGKFIGDWELCRRLGSGAFGEVHHWKNQRTQLEIATKSLKPNNSLGKDEEHKLKERWQQEYEFSKKVNTDFIVRGLNLKDTNFWKYLNEKHAWWPLPVMVMEYCNGGDLRSHLQKIDNVNGLIEYEVREILRTLRHGIDYMHNQCNIKHRDLKPDNIVIHKMPNGKRIYKLTDFGFARFINDRTMLQSVVGTRNYFAPEIVDTSEYTKTVDYWSAGVIAYELICGNLPFIPHQIFYHIINTIKSKPSTCIAITENFTQKDTFENHEHIFEGNHISSVFCSKIEYWLRMALDSNFRTRGTVLVKPNEIQNVPGGRVNMFYSTIDDLLKTKVLTLFILNTYSFHEMEISQNMKFVDFENDIKSAINTPQNNLFYIPPTGHGLKRSCDAKQPYDYYMENWQDTNDQSNPPVMLFLIDISNKKDIFNVNTPKISAAIKHFCGFSENDQTPLWLLQKTVYDIHYLLTNEQRHLATMLYGIKEYAMNIEDEMLNDFKIIENLQLIGYCIRGRIIQYNAIKNEVIHKLPKTADTIRILNIDQNFELEIEKAQQAISNLDKRFKSAMRRIRDEANSNFYKELTEKDIYKVKKFREHLLTKHQGARYELLLKPVKRCNYCYDIVYQCLDKRNSTLKDIISKSLRKIFDIHEEYFIIKAAAQNASEFFKKKELDIQEYTNRLNNAIIDSLALNIPTNGNEEHHSSSLMINTYNSKDGEMQKSTTELITEATEYMDRMAMDICEVPDRNTDISISSIL